MCAKGGPIEFFDTEELSRDVMFTDVWAVQRERGKFQATIDRRSFQDWHLQHLVFNRGTSICSGSAASDRYSFIVPLRIGANCRLLGRDLAEHSIGAYAPGGEHADISSEGLVEVVLTAPADLMTRAERLGISTDLPAVGSAIISPPSTALSPLQHLLISIVSSKGELDSGSGIEFAVADALERELLGTLMPQPDRARPGRSSISRALVMRRLHDLLESAEQGPISASDLTRAAGISYPTLQRVFFEWFGMGPVSYLHLRRMYAARRRLLSGRFASVTEVATSCGFWELGRFSVRYKAQFGESPAVTLAHGQRLRVTSFERRTSSRSASLIIRKSAANGGDLQPPA